MPVADASPSERADAALRRAVYYLDRGFEPAGKAKAFANARKVVEELGDDELEVLVAAGKLTDLDGIGPSTSSVISDAVLGNDSEYLAKLERTTRQEATEGSEIRAAIKGDLHSHTTWSDGGATLREMVEASIALGHQYQVITDHSARLTIAHGLNEERLQSQLAEIAVLNMEYAPFRILTGMEVDILEDGTLDLSDEMLAQLDVVVASVHSKLRMDEREMTRRMVMAVASPHVDVLGHCTGRKVVGRGGPRRGSMPRSSSQRVPGSTPRSRSTAGPSAATHPRTCWSSRWSGAARCRSTPTPTHRGSSSGSRGGATSRPAWRSSRSASSTPTGPTTSSPGPPRTRPTE